MATETGSRAERLAQYRDGYRELVAALDGITAAEWDAREAPGEWSPREIVHHLADSEMMAATRLMRLIGDDEPRIPYYDQDVWVGRLHYAERSVDASLAAFRGARESTISLFGCLTDADWEKAGVHEAVGRFPVDLWLEYYGPHAHDHADQIRRARAAAV